MDLLFEAAFGKGIKDSVTSFDLINDDFLTANLLASKSCLFPSSHIYVPRFCSYTFFASLLFHIPLPLVIFLAYSRLPESAHSLSPYLPISNYHRPVLRRGRRPPGKTLLCG
jgi:hypothetical protein